MLPAIVKIKNNTPVQISTFSNSSLCATANGKLYGWGNNAKSRLGITSTT